MNIMKRSYLVRSQLEYETTVLNKRGMGWGQLTRNGTGSNKRGGDQRLNPSGDDCGYTKG